jgi:CMP-N-acetylneuraminic acid synthetase
VKTVAFVPLKLNNERLPGKNTRRFRSGRPLFHAILASLAEVEAIDEVFVYCSDPAITELLPEGVRYLSRSTDLDRSDTRINAVIAAFVDDVPADVYVLAHATAPFLSSASIRRMVEAVRSGDHDSALSVVPLREFLWKDGAPANYDPAHIPRTQDLEPLFAETSGVYVFRRELAVGTGRRVGEQAALIEVSDIEAVDVDDATDFVIADAIDAYLSSAPESTGEAR